MKNPRMGKFETNINAKEWILIEHTAKFIKLKTLKIGRAITAIYLTRR